MTTTITHTELMSSPPMATLSARNSIALPSSTQKTQQIEIPITTYPPRIDVEPIYSQLKTSIGDNWQLYKATVAEFVLGKRNQAELSWIVDPFLRGDPQRESLHNQLIMSLFANAQREPPDLPGVAMWVAANDKPAAAAKPVTGDVTETKLKHEIMQLSARERYRLKNLQEDPTDCFEKAMQQDINDLQIKLPDMGGASTAGYSRTNWEPEIRKRYAQPLFLESNEFPDPDSLPGRVLPICYEEGIFNGYANTTIDLVNIAAETYMKEILARLFASTRSNGPRLTWIKSAAYKKRVDREQAQFESGEIRKSVTGLLPIEQEAENNRRPLSMFDIRLNIHLGGSNLGTHNPRALTIFESTGIDDEVLTGDTEMMDAPPLLSGITMAPPNSFTNGVTTNGVLTNGIHKDVEMSDDYGWRGGTESDRRALDDVLDDCLAGL